MRRLSAETAKARAPDAAQGLRDRTGDTRKDRCGGPLMRCVARQRAAQAARFPAGSIRRPPVEDNRYSPPGPSGASLKHRAGRRRDRRTCGHSSGNASASRDAEVRGSAAGTVCASRTPGVPRPLGLSRSRSVTEIFETIGDPGAGKFKNRGAAERWLIRLRSRAWSPPSSRRVEPAGEWAYG